MTLRLTYGGRLGLIINMIPIFEFPTMYWWTCSKIIIEIIIIIIDILV